MTALNQTEMLVLAHLSHRMFGSENFVTPYALLNRLSSDLNAEHLDVILHYLYTSGLAEQKEAGGMVLYRASLAGNAAIRAASGMIGQEESTRLRARVSQLAEAYSRPTPQKKATDWTKWGTIFAGVSIIVSIFLTVLN